MKITLKEDWEEDNTLDGSLKEDYIRFDMENDFWEYYDDYSQEENLEEFYDITELTSDFNLKEISTNTLKDILNNLKEYHKLEEDTTLTQPEARTGEEMKFIVQDDGTFTIYQNGKKGMTAQVKDVKKFIQDLKDSNFKVEENLKEDDFKKINNLEERIVFGFGDYPYELYFKNQDGNWYLHAFNKTEFTSEEIERMRKEILRINNYLPEFKLEYNPHKKDNLSEDLLLQPTNKDKEHLDELITKYKDSKYEKILNDLKAKYEFEERANEMKSLEENLKIDSEVEVIKTGEKGKVIKFEDDLYTIKLDNDEEIKATLDELKFNDKDNLSSEDIDDKGNIINKEDTSTDTDEAISKVIDVEESETPPTTKKDILYAQDVSNNVGILDMIKELIKDELDAVQGYNNAIAACINSGYDKFISTFASLVSEETVHIGELQKLQSILQPNVLTDLQDGQDEAKEDLEKIEE